MMKRTITTTTVAALCLIANAAGIDPAHAAGRYGAVTRQIGIPSGDTTDFNGETSFRGIGLDFRKVVQRDVTTGLMLGWNVFYERQYGTQVADNVTVTGTQDRYINAFPIMVGVHRYFGEKRTTRPYVGINAGGFIVKQRLEVGVFSVDDTSWDWGIAPEVGLVIPRGRAAAFFVNARYNWSFTHQNLADEDSDLTYWGINVGFAWEQY
jgi:outer membrane protein W